MFYKIIRCQQVVVKMMPIMVLVRLVGAIWHLPLLIKIKILAEPLPTMFNRNKSTIQGLCLVYSYIMEVAILMKVSTRALRHIKRPCFTSTRLMVNLSKSLKNSLRRNAK